MTYSTWFFPSSSFHSKSCIQQMMITSCFFFIHLLEQLVAYGQIALDIVKAVAADNLRLVYTYNEKKRDFSDIHQQRYIQ